MKNLGPEAAVFADAGDQVVIKGTVLAREEYKSLIAEFLYSLEIIFIDRMMFRQDQRKCILVDQVPGNPLRQPVQAYETQVQLIFFQ
ncbi:hypothetical protein D3C87_1602750 [compost metagenome]